MTARRAPVAPGLLAPIVVGILALVLAGCGPAPSTPASVGTPAPGATASATAPADVGPAIPASPVTGVLLRVASEGLARVKGFKLRTDDGQELEFDIGTLENGVEFPPGHLAEHLASASPVRVFFRREGERLVVYRIEDAAG